MLRETVSGVLREFINEFFFIPFKILCNFNLISAFEFRNKLIKTSATSDIPLIESITFNPKAQYLCKQSISF